MYESFYGFTERPFNLTPDSEFFYASSKHVEALSCLLLAIRERNGFVVITGEVGSGKTTVCRTLLNKLDSKTKVVLIFNTHLGKKELLTTILEDLSIEYKSTSKTHLLSALNKYLIEQVENDSNVVLIIDEAQNLAPAVIEEIRMLSNLETEKEKLIQIILVGQPQLREKLALPELEQFRQRVTFHYHLEPLSYPETKEYIKHRLMKAGNGNSNIFTHPAIDAIYKYAKGIPRLINLTCHSALISGFVYNTKQINSDLAAEVINELVEGIRHILPSDYQQKLQKQQNHKKEQNHKKQQKQQKPVLPAALRNRLLKTAKQTAKEEALSCPVSCPVSANSAVNYKYQNGRIIRWVKLRKR